MDERVRRNTAADFIAEIAEHIREGRVAAISLEWADGAEVSVKVVPLYPATFAAHTYEAEGA